MNTVKSKDDAKAKADYDDFFAVKPTLKKQMLNPPNNQLSASQTNQSRFISFAKPLKTIPKFEKEDNSSVSAPVIVINPRESKPIDVPPDHLLICSWNINGLRPVTEKNFLQNYFKMRKPDILCLSETKSSQETIDSRKLTGWIPWNYTYYANCSKIKKGCYGTGIITKHKPLSIQYGIGSERFDDDGRTMTFEYEKFYLVNCYVPNSADDFSHLTERVNEWDPLFRAYLNKLKAKKPVVLAGDLNIIHKNIDIARLVELGKVAGSSEEEKSNFNTLLKTGFVDTFRHFYPQEKKYTWWNFKILIHRKQNKGRRYDYVLVSDDALKGVKDAFIDDHVYGSDHCPVGIVFNPNIEKDSDQPKETLNEEIGSLQNSQESVGKQSSLTSFLIDSIDVSKHKSDVKASLPTTQSSQVICIDSD